MIPIDRPVVGKDLEAISQEHGLQAGDAIWLFGLSPNTWSSIVRARQRPDAGVTGENPRPTPRTEADSKISESK
jgi:hypothetical protein